MNFNLLNLLLLAACLGLSFLLSGLEAGLFALNRLRLRRLARDGNRRAKLLNDLLAQPERILWTILVGNTLVNFAILGWTLAQLHEAFTGYHLVIVVAFGLLVFLFYAFFDLLPKMVFRAHPDSLCLHSAGLFRLIYTAFAPLVSLVEYGARRLLRFTGGQALAGQLFGNREEMRAVLQEAALTLTHDEHAMINRILDLQKYTVSQYLVPLDRVHAVEKHQPLAAALELARVTNRSRFPVWEKRGPRRRVVGLLHVGMLLFRDDLDPRRAVGDYLEPAVFVPHITRLEQALRRMQRGGQRLAIVLDGENREMGIITIEDILKVMFGELKM